MLWKVICDQYALSGKVANYLVYFEASGRHCAEDNEWPMDAGWRLAPTSITWNIPFLPFLKPHSLPPLHESNVTATDSAELDGRMGVGRLSVLLLLKISYWKQGSGLQV